MSVPRNIREDAPLQVASHDPAPLVERPRWVLGALERRVRPATHAALAARSSICYGRVMLWRLGRTLLYLGSVAALGCQSTGTSREDGATSTLVACTWPQAFDRADASDGSCWAARAYVTCSASSGGGLACMSDSLTECPANTLLPGVSYSGCKNQCNWDEFALACGGPGPGDGTSEPPVNCRTLPSGPGGGSFSCCRCATQPTSP